MTELEITETAPQTPRPRRSLRVRGAATVLILAAIAVVGWWIASQPRGETTARADGESVIEEFAKQERVQTQPFRAKMLNGPDLDTRDLIGGVVVYNVWGSWCVPCATEAPALVKNANNFAGKVTFVGINVRDNDAAARAFEREHEVPYDSVVTEDSAPAMLSFQGALAAAAVPTTLVIDREGGVAARVIGPVTATTLEELISTVLAESDEPQ